MEKRSKTMKATFCGLSSISLQVLNRVSPTAMAGSLYVRDAPFAALNAGPPI